MCHVARKGRASLEILYLMEVQPQAPPISLREGWEVLTFIISLIFNVFKNVPGSWMGTSAEGEGQAGNKECNQQGVRLERPRRGQD